MNPTGNENALQITAGSKLYYTKNANILTIFPVGAKCYHTNYLSSTEVILSFLGRQFIYQSISEVHFYHPILICLE